jgi:hypothetical protein
MYNSKLIDVLKKFDPTEIERLKAFMVSPYFVKQQSLIQFGKLILEEYPHFQIDKVNENTIYESLFPRQKFQFKTISDLMTQMISTIHSFLHFENYLKDDIEQQLRLLSELRSRNFGKEFLRIGKKFRLQLDLGKNDQEYFNHLTKYEDEMDHYFIRQKENRGFSQYLQDKSDAFDFYYLATKLKMTCEIINRQNIFSSKYEISLLEEVLEYINQHIDTFSDMPAIFIYYKIILTLLKPEEESNFFDLRNLLDNATKLFSSVELKDMYNYAQNYCIKKINSGKFIYVSELFGLYKKQLDGGIIFEDNLLSQWDYKNIVAIALRLHEFDWTENFILRYKNYIHHDYMDVAYTHSMANLYYEKKDYTKALKMLNNFNNAIKDISDPGFDDTFYNLDSRSLLLKIYYELNDDEPLRAIIDSFKLYIKRNKKISERQMYTYINLIKYTKKLSDLRIKLELKPQTDKTISELKHKINSEKNIANLTWLQSQVEKLEREIKP